MFQSKTSNLLFSDLSINRIDNEYPFREERSSRYRSMEDVLRSARSEKKDQSIEDLLQIQENKQEEDIFENIKLNKYKGYEKLRQNHIEIQKKLILEKTENQKKKLKFFERQAQKNNELLNRLIHQKLIQPDSKNDKLEYITKNKNRNIIGTLKNGKSVLNSKTAKHRQGSVLDPLKYENFYEHLNMEKLNKKISFKDELQFQNVRFNKKEFDKYIEQNGGRKPNYLIN